MSTSPNELFAPPPPRHTILYYVIDCAALNNTYKHIASSKLTAIMTRAHYFVVKINNSSATATPLTWISFSNNVIYIDNLYYYTYFFRSSGSSESCRVALGLFRRKWKRIVRQSLFKDYCGGHVSIIMCTLSYIWLSYYLHCTWP